MRKVSSMKLNQGFSLIEMMVSVVLMAIILSIAAPITDVLREIRHNYQAKRMLGAANFAANEAIKRQARVNICGSVTGTGCDATDHIWPGWAIYVDDNQDGSFDTGEEIIRYYRPNTDFHLDMGTNTDISFNADGVEISSVTFFGVCSTGDDIILEFNHTGRRFAQYKNKLSYNYC